jgi:hypothetical protein
MAPPPVQRPHPPIWVGGNSTAAIRRAAERGQGWVPFPNPPGMRVVRTPPLSDVDELRRRIDVLREHAAAIGRTEPLDICFSPFASGAGAILDELHTLEELGVTWTVLGAGNATTRAGWIEGARRIADEVVAPFRAGRSS